jgi:DNA topoisomerase-1
VNVFPGFILLYQEGKDEAEEEKERVLPHLKEGEELELLGLFPEQRFTQPPPRFTEATLIKVLEQWGIGRPSTYAPILSTIQERGYVSKVNGYFQPTELGMVVNELLTRYFADIVDIKFTARMEDELDEIVNRNKDWVSVVQEFYTPLEKDLENASRLIAKVKLADELTEELCPECGKPLAIKTGRYGKFLACSGYPKCKYTKPFQVKVGVSCPQCGGELVERINKKKRIFYSCSNYPECQFITNFRPLPQSCPNCGGLLTLFKGKWTKCIKCDYRGKLKPN